MQHPEEGTIHVWLDRELPAEEAAALEAHVVECAECAAAVAEARGFIAASSRIVSALDAVPGGVIPIVAPRRRAWYSSTQLRAAAAVVVVAGASLLVMRGREPSSMEHLMTASAPAQKETSVTPSQPEVSSAPASRPTAMPPVAAAVPDLSAKALPSAVEQPARGVSQKPEPAVFQVLRGEVSGAMVTGAAAAPANELLQLRTDTLVGVMRTVYSVSPGVEVTLTESSAQVLSAAATPESKALPQAAPVPPGVGVPAPARRGAATPVINSIAWVQKATGRMATLSGPISKEQLEALRQKLPSDRR